jgi:hypothetical protein
LYSNEAQLNDGVDGLRAAGYRNADISVLFPDNRGTKDFAHEKHTKAPEGTTAGAASGLAIGGALGWLAGIGVLAIPGIGPFIAAGPIVAALAGAGAGGAIGGLIGALVGMGIPEYEAKRYEGRIRGGSILISVHCDNSEWVGRAKDILKRTGAEDIGSAGEAAADFATSDKPLPRR